MKFRPESRGDSPRDVGVRWIAHGLALGGAGLAVYWSLQDRSALPLAVAFAVLSGLEGLWVWHSRRR